LHPEPARIGEVFDAVFSDIVMPGQGGIDIAREIRAR
jgi:CheY-like chemotaxis protein